MYKFPKDLYADIRIEEIYSLSLGIENAEIKSDSVNNVNGAMIRVFDGTMWYTSTTNNLEEIQQELDNLATIATPNPDILDHPMIRKLQVHQDRVLHFEDDKDVRQISRQQWKELLDGYIEDCVDTSIPEISVWWGNVSGSYRKKSFYSSKGAAIIQDWQECFLNMGFGITVDGITTYGGKSYNEFCIEDLKGHKEEILQLRERYLDYAHNAKQLDPGEYTCVLAPFATAMFVHESFGHKSEADYMLNDKALQEEWTIGKKVGSEKVSICDRGDMLNHGYTPYDDEGTKAVGSWLMKNGVLTGRLHDAKSAATLEEELTGNARAQLYMQMPIVRMTNTYMEAGQDDPERMLKEVEDGIYIRDVISGTGMATFTMKPSLAYRIRNGEICEPVRINVLTGSVFETLFDIDAVGTDWELFDTYNCGKGGQTVMVSAGGPSIRVKKMRVN